MAAITKPLTATEIKAAKPKEKEYKLFDGGGLFLSVPKSGRKRWRIKYRFNGKEKLLSFDWFRWLYNKIISAFEWVKHTRIYQDVKISISHIKSKIKLYKTKLSSGESKILRRYKGLYKRLKQRFKAN